MISFRLAEEPVTQQPPVIMVEPIKTEDKKEDAFKSEKHGSGRVLVIFGLSIVLLPFFLLIALSIYNLLMK